MGIAALQTADRAFNILGYIPFVSNISGSARTVYGIAQIVAAIVLTVLAASATAPVAAPITASALAVSGLLHIFRGYIPEQIPFVGNALCLAYDISKYLIFAL